MSAVKKIVVVGLGYVGLPLAWTLAQTYPTVGYDIDDARVADLKMGGDRTNTVDHDDLVSSRLVFTSDPKAIHEANIIIVTVPTPITGDKQPDLEPVTSASETVGNHMSRDSIVIYESTVYPGVTEDICIPILEERSGLRAGQDFAVGYSPERINPGDGLHSLKDTVKIIAAQDDETLGVMAEIYGSVIDAGLHRAPNIRVAEAAKIIENIQRDVNIALINELSKLFHAMNLDTADILRAAGTKWNFIDFRPGLVGGHCIPVDPYYLSYAAESVQQDTEIILAGRRVNNSMSTYVVEQTLRQLKSPKAGTPVAVLVLGLTYKPDVSDVRNSLAIEVVLQLIETGAEVEIFDPMILPEQLSIDMRKRLLPSLPTKGSWDGIILAVSHSQFAAVSPAKYISLLNTGNARAPVFIDVSRTLDSAPFDDAGITYWAL
jgi:UDP-N-acetyl-D-galactosamine dehydrogenase